MIRLSLVVVILVTMLTLAAYAGSLDGVRLGPNTTTTTTTL